MIWLDREQKQKRKAQMRMQSERGIGKRQHDHYATMYHALQRETRAIRKRALEWLGDITVSSVIRKAMSWRLEAWLECRVRRENA